MGLYYSTLVFIQFLFGANFVISKIIVGKLDPITFSSIRFIISGLFLILVQLIRKDSLKIPRDKWILLLWLSVVGIGFGQAFFMLGLQKTSPVNTSLISSTIPLFVFMINRFRKIGDWNIQKGLGIFLSFAGVLMLRNIENFDFKQSAFQGDLLVLAACFCLGVMLSYSRDLFIRVSAMTGSAYMFLLGGLTLLPWVFFDSFKGGNELLHLNFVGAFLFAVFGATCLTYLLNNWVLAKVDSSVVGLFIFLQPVVASLLAFFFFQEPITYRMGLSFLLIFIGVLMVVRPKLSKR